MDEDEEYDDELPPISVNSSTRESGGMVMPSAEELASQRAREAECERALLRLRAADDPFLATADSSGSEGEAALAQAVTRLAVEREARARRGEAAPVRALLPALLARLPLPPRLAHALNTAEPDHLTDTMCSAAVSGVDAESAPLCAAWLCAASVGGAGGAGEAGDAPRAGARAAARARRRRCRRALYAMLARPPFDDPDSEASRTLRAALADGAEGAARRELADALAPARGSLPPRLRRDALRAALCDLLQCEGPSADDSSTCLCSWTARAVCGAIGTGAATAGAAAALRLAGRALRACPAGAGAGAGGPACAAARARLLAALAAPAPAARAAPDRLEVLVGASKLQLLFRE